MKYFGNNTYQLKKKKNAENIKKKKSKVINDRDSESIERQYYLRCHGDEIQGHILNRLALSPQLFSKAMEIISHDF